uniref:Uncharacterized protein n=1 Tax=Cucumis melo TaxID=3656 RepID=A0A9I9CS92_CUCME
MVSLSFCSCFSHHILFSFREEEDWQWGLIGGGPGGISTTESCPTELTNDEAMNSMEESGKRDMILCFLLEDPWPA